MKDFALSENEAVQRQLDRLGALPLPKGTIGLDTTRALLDRLGNPERELPPVFHVAGTNGKGSTCAFLRAMLEAEGYKVHVATKPHLVRYNERIRIAGELISDALLASLLEEVLDACEGLNPSFFEVTTAAMFLAFHRNSADACVIEVGLGGRFDATNVLEKPAACGIASLGIDHEHFLLTPDPTAPKSPLARIAFEKAGIARPGVPLVTMDYPDEANQAVFAQAEKVGAPLYPAGSRWHFAEGIGKRTGYRDAKGSLFLPEPPLEGWHQRVNSALAAAMLRHQDVLPVSVASLKAGTLAARWPARLQVLGPGPLTELLPARRLLLDGGHNPDAAMALADYFTENNTGPIDALIGMMALKDARNFLTILAPHLASVTAVPIEGNDHLALDVLEGLAKEAGVAQTSSAPDLVSALEALPQRNGGTVLIAGSLYLAGKVLAANREVPD
ncbi:MAG: bifunctional folylpolyglutamate synthase/dihydrofolate synthase [Erythrobacter sp.]|nr:MAG: bifunctional folylpolyglutamate synthase/dihydrofolate synthase [Erythrobacter sp.]